MLGRWQGCWKATCPGPQPLVESPLDPRIDPRPGCNSHSKRPTRSTLPSLISKSSKPNPTKPNQTKPNQPPAPPSPSKAKAQNQIQTFSKGTIRRIVFRFQTLTLLLTRKSKGMHKVELFSIAHLTWFLFLLKWLKYIAACVCRSSLKIYFPPSRHPLVLHGPCGPSIYKTPASHIFASSISAPSTQATPRVLLSDLHLLHCLSALPSHLTP